MYVGRYLCLQKVVYHSWEKCRFYHFSRQLINLVGLKCWTLFFGVNWNLTSVILPLAGVCSHVYGSGFMWKFGKSLYTRFGAFLLTLSFSGSSHSHYIVAAVVSWSPSFASLRPERDDRIFHGVSDTLCYVYGWSLGWKL